MNGRFGSMGQAHRRPDQQSDPPPSAVAPTQAAGIQRARTVIISGTGSAVGLFVYNGTPTVGNLIASITESSTDLFGNKTISGGYTAYNNGVGQAMAFQENGLLVSTGSLAAGWTQQPAALTSDGKSWSIGNQVWYVPSGDTTGAKDAAFLNGLAAAASVYLVPGTYYINAALTPRTNTSFIGAGAGATVINQVTNAAEGITCTNKSTVTLRGFTLVGNGSGTSTAAGIHFSSNPPTANHILDDIIVQNFGLQGFLFDSVFLTELRKCEALANGGSGFQVTNSFAVPTSFSFHTCYANANLGTYGYELDALQYSSLSGCAADNNATGYGLLGCQGVTLTSCGTEAFTATGYLFNNCKGCGLYGGFTFNGKTKVAWVTNGTTRQTIGGLTETSPAVGATACVQTDAATSSILWGITHVTADSLTAGTFTNVDGSA